VARLHGLSLMKEEIELAACLSPDVRNDILMTLIENNSTDCQWSSVDIPEWLSAAPAKNYFDSFALDSLKNVMKSGPPPRILEDGVSNLGTCKAEKELFPFDDDSNASSNCTEIDGSSVGSKPFSSDEEVEDKFEEYNNELPTLCLICRRPCKTLCPQCEAAYICLQTNECYTNGWSHQCLCRTWKQYALRRDSLSSFSFEGWHQNLVTRPFQKSEKPYAEFLRNIGVYRKGWWSTETKGWAGGLGGSARSVDISLRRSYKVGFVLDESLCPKPDHVEEEKSDSSFSVDRDDRGLIQLNSWEDYYRLRSIPLTSPVALLLTFPLTIYYSIQRFGEVPLTVAKILNRKLRIHVVGIEKELNFLDLFAEIGYLLPRHLPVELCLICREDMVPPKCTDLCQGDMPDNQLTENLTLKVITGRYNESLDPNFDIGSGPPDMIIGCNAGLFAYKSWASVIDYLDCNSGVVGAFSDYNEHSGTNCASLGGRVARDSLVVNPFRQPRAMPVQCMNLPQMSNCFLYVYNMQEVDV